MRLGVCLLAAGLVPLLVACATSYTVSSFLHAAEDGNARLVQTHIEAGISPFSAQCKALMLAYRNGDRRTIDLLVDAGVPQNERLAEMIRLHDRERMLALQSALKLYYLDFKVYPFPDQFHGALRPYVKDETMFIDWWGRPFVYEDTLPAPSLYSLGADNRPGGTGYFADVRTDDPETASVPPAPQSCR